MNNKKEENTIQPAERKEYKEGVKVKSALETFKSSLSNKERESDIIEWERARVGEYIQALSNTIQTMFNNINEASKKTLVTLSLTLNEKKISCFSYDIEAEGSLFGVKKESFKGSVTIFRTPEALKKDLESEELKEGGVYFIMISTL